MKKFLQIVSGLTQERPHPMSFKSVPEAFPETPQILGHGYESFGGRTRPAAVITFFLSHIGAATQKDAADFIGCDPEIGLRAISEIGG